MQFQNLNTLFYQWFQQPEVKTLPIFGHILKEIYIQFVVQLQWQPLYLTDNRDINHKHIFHIDITINKNVLSALIIIIIMIQNCMLHYDSDIFTADNWHIFWDQLKRNIQAVLSYLQILKRSLMHYNKWKIKEILYSANHKIHIYSN